VIEKGRKWNGKEGEMEGFKRKYKPSTTKPRQPIGQRYGMVKMLQGKLSHFKIHIIEGHLSVRTSLQLLSKVTLFV
jgi:hypothetical protein